MILAEILLYFAVSAAVIVITALPVKFFTIVILPPAFTLTDLLSEEYVSFAPPSVDALIFTVCAFFDTFFVISDALIVLSDFADCGLIVNDTLTLPV